MKKTICKITALCLCAILLTGGVVFSAYALNTDRPVSTSGEDSTDKAEADETAAESDKIDDTSSRDTSTTKEETVYVLTEADGSVQKVIVSDWLKNTLGSQTLTDETDLTDIENVKGEESYTPEGNHSYLWDAQGNDIYYQGSIEKELPVNIAVSYKLDGKPISPSELAGKSGKVTIRFDYTNQQFSYVDIDGQKEKIYVPFTMLTGLILDDENFSNIEISNGKLINDGTRSIAIGIAFPGLQENLALSQEELEIPDYVEITADAKDFQMDISMTLASNALFNELDTDELDSIDDLSASMGELTDAMEQLLDGSSQLYEGLSTLLDRSKELTDGIDQLAAGSQTLQSGVNDLDAGAARLQAGAAQLSDGLNTLTANNDSLNGGARQVFTTLLSAANTQLASAGLSVPALTIDNYADVLTGVIASLDENAVYEQALAAVTAAVNEQRAQIEEQVAAAIQEQVSAQVTAAVQEQVSAQVTQAVRETVEAQVIETVTQMDPESYHAAVEAGLIDEATQAAIEEAINQQMQSDSIIQTIEDQTAEQMASEKVQATIQTQISEQMASEAIQEMIASNTELQVQKIINEQMASEEVQAQFAAAASGAQSVISLKTSLDTYRTFYLGLQTYTTGVASAAAGASTLEAGMKDLKDGTGKLSSGASELNSGILTMKDAAPALIDGITQLQDGAMQLSDGLKEFNEEGIQKLAEAVDEDLDAVIARFRATKEVSQNYRTFAGAPEDMDSQVQFIYRTDSIKNE